MTFSWLAAWWQVILALALIGVGSWLSWQHWNRLGRKRNLLWLEVVRWSAIVWVALTLLQPELIRKMVRTESPEVLVLVDKTGSMETTDVATAIGAVSRDVAVAQVLEDPELIGMLERQGKVVVEEFGSEGNGTDLNAVLERVANRAGNVRAVILMTDGDWNLGEPPVSAASRLRQRGVPVYAIGAGSDRHLPDVILELVAPPAYGLVGEQIAVPFAVRNYLNRRLEARVSLRVGNKMEGEKMVEVAPGAWREDAILWAPQKVGDYELVVEVPEQPDELVTTNNRATFKITVRAETLKVLVVDSEPRWEFRFLRNALQRDPGVEVSCVLLHPGMDPAAGPTYLPGFPREPEALAKYDVVFLGDVGVGPGGLTSEQAESLVGLVRQQGSGLVFLPGRRGRMMSILDSALEELLPVTLDRNQARGFPFTVEQRLTLTERGAGHFLTFLGKSEEENQKIWRGLPGFNWSAPVIRNKPGTEVLAMHATQRNEWGRLPLLVASNAGNGKVLFMGLETAWRWRRGVEDLYHYRFWSQVVRWMAHKRYLAAEKGIRLSYAPERPALGETVFLQAIVSDDSGFPVREGTVSGRVAQPDGTVESFNMDLQEDGWGLFTSRLQVKAPGSMRVTLNASNGARLETEIPVLESDRERVGQPANFGALREVAGTTRGEFFEVSRAREAFEEVSVLPEVEPAQARIRLWSEPGWILGLGLLLMAYWVGRKVAGMF